MIWSLISLPFEQVNLNQPVSVQPVVKSIQFSGLAQLKGQIFSSETSFLIISSQLGLLSEQSWVTLIEYENKKLICSGDLGFYQKRSLPPISVTNKRSRGTEIETMSNLRNLFCMVAFDFFINTYLQPNKTTCNVQSSMYNPTTKSFRQLFIFFDNY